MEVKKSQQIVEDQGSSDETSQGQSLPAIDARVSGKSVLIKVLCQKRKGVLVRILGEVEKLNMAVVSTTLNPFGGLSLDDITVVAEMDRETNVETGDIARTLRAALQVDEN